MSGEVAIGEETIEASKTLVPGADAAGTSATKIEHIHDQQTGARWGVEPGAQFFRDRYVDGLQETRQQLKYLEDRLNAYVAAVQSAAVEFTDQDDEAAAAITAAMAKQSKQELVPDQGD